MRKYSRKLANFRKNKKQTKRKNKNKISHFGGYNEPEPCKKTYKQLKTNNLTWYKRFKENSFEENIFNELKDVYNFNCEEIKIYINLIPIIALLFKVGAYKEIKYSYELTLEQEEKFKKLNKSFLNNFYKFTKNDINKYYFYIILFFKKSLMSSGNINNTYINTEGNQDIVSNEDTFNMFYINKLGTILIDYESIKEYYESGNYDVQNNFLKQKFLKDHLNSNNNITLMCEINQEIKKNKARQFFDYFTYILQYIIIRSYLKKKTFDKFIEDLIIYSILNFNTNYENCYNLNGGSQEIEQVRQDFLKTKVLEIFNVSENNIPNYNMPNYYENNNNNIIFFKFIYDCITKLEKKERGRLVTNKLETGRLETIQETSGKECGKLKSCEQCINQGCAWKKKKRSFFKPGSRKRCRRYGKYEEEPNKYTIKGEDCT